MSVRLIAFALFTLLAATHPAAAFNERHDHWHVMTAGALACAAFNRPPEEFNAAPYAALSLRQRRGQPPKLQVFAWPGVFQARERADIDIEVGTGTVLQAEAFDTYAVEAKEALPDTAVAEMREKRFVTVRVKGMPQVLVFDMTQIAAVLKSLDACARQLPGSP